MRAGSWATTAGLVVMSVVVWLSSSVRGETVTVGLERATVQDITKVLAEQTGWQLTFVGPRKPAQEEVVIARFKAERRPLKEVLRAACQQTGYRYRRVGPELFWVEQGHFEETPYRAGAGDYVVGVEGLTLSGGQKGLYFARGAAEPSSFPSTLAVTLSIEAATDEGAEMIHGFRDFRLTDDTGKELRISPTLEQWAQMQVRRMNFFPTPDRAELQVHFDLPAAGATRIVALNGTLVLYQQCQRLEFKFDDLTAENVTLGEGGLEVTLQNVRVTPNGANVNLVNRVLEAVPEPEPEEWGTVTVMLLDKEGRSQKNKTRLFPNSPTAYGVNFPEDFVPARLVFQVVRRRYPTRELPFAIEKIPLPR